MEAVLTHSEKIIIVDDVPECAFIVESLLEDAGITNFLTYNDPTDVLDYIKDNDHVSLIITDFKMPKMSGIELLNNARKLNDQIKGVIISSDPALVSSINHNYPIIEKGNEAFKNLVPCVNTLLAAITAE
jgi:CheY-like chemotaxis protein